jgi:flagellin-like protein
MQFKQLLNDDDAVSPVIGVILMVAITVILAAVIGTFVLGLGDQVQQTSPTAQFSFDYTEDYDGNGNAELYVTHDGGDGIEEARLSFAGDVSDSSVANVCESGSWQTGDAVTAGDDCQIVEANGANNALNTGAESVSVVWNAEDGDRSSTLAEWEA